ncbi:TonB-linked SusC/RagA family outer membrane protein [Parabacteroides sp. PF5-5]|uniref:SusC/RagA family TonB-linked outer membrane protein n=1 Tax=unclassified Parabacteroides TaxID=2649774 RepID=UPI0024747F8C|nr:MULTISPECIES: TonB-dependent receptor [unclassified Parabacteroides]MDH6304586.1 TonB-linked SusC/RagA family outer membrane protein [Parabacteroides sp. PH5-39]MDH6315801.1 TonB-linked SusC/RagA family outer membrane protein [Parabacteroides sp. PF5-13]MDH6319460.1 TonB-linked SusC/RagA family outer membrane protein [Parabacteroides sp. PH5-13]MDH6323191.1 TonB-linked SusC/RagA family outer membrane protein [Parabacteroides sp. PH5-8]MDH6326993.1 TonB-linked SusC/RagA family outer membrane
MKIHIKHTSLIYFFIMLFVIGVSQHIQAQDITVNGVVTDKKQEPLPGANIRVAGSNTGTITDFDGKFSLSCPAGSNLEISYIGYVTQTVRAASNLKVELDEDAVALGEAVVVGIGYGTMRKSDLTGAIASVNSDDLKKGIVTSAEQLLQGKVAGLSVVQGSGDPASGATVRLRGGTSLSASNSPLVVVDGIPGVDFNTVQPSEIVSIDILKDASSAAIYGSRGANGVIIVTTNRSTSNVERRSIEYNGYVAVGQVANHMDLLSANQWRQYVRGNNIANATDYGGDTDWQKELERTAVSHSHNLFINNVTANSGLSASITYQDNQGVIKRSNMDRLSGSVSGHQYALDKRLKVEIGVSGTVDNWNPIDTRIFERAANLNPTVPVTDRNGEYTSIGGTNTENPVELLNNRTFDDSRHRFLGYGKIEFEIIKGLKAAANGSYEYNSHQRRTYVPTYAVMEGKAEKGRGERHLGDYKNYQLEAYLTYDVTFNDIHKLNVMGGYSYLRNTYEGFGATRRGFDTDLFEYNNLAAGSDYRAGDVYSYKGQADLISFYGRVNYNLMGKYMFTATLRDDGSSRFGKNNKWGLFPSASVAWRVSDEDFMASTSSWLDNLKLRFGYGVTGNQDGIGEYKSLAILAADGASYYDATTGTWKKSYAPNQNTNPDLKWESTAQLNLGIDFGLFSRVNGSLEFYHKKTTDLLWTYPVAQPPYLVGTMLANVGDLTNKGVELTLNGNIMETKDFTWDANFNVSYNDQNIDKLSNEAFQESGLKTGSLHGLRGMSGQYAQIVKEGYPAGAFYGPKCQGIDENGAYIINRDENGNPVDEYLGSAQPKVNIGFGMNFTYKDFDLGFSTYGMFGQKVLNATGMSMYDPTRLPSQNVPDDFLSSGIKTDPLFSDYWVENGSFFRLQSATLGYTIPNTKKFGMQKIRVYLTGENLFVITGYSGVDPEVNINGLDDPGIERFNAYPRPRTFSFGLNVTF